MPTGAIAPALSLHPLTVDSPMDLFQAILLGIIQGLTEFLPISSSGHLVVVPKLLGWPDHSLAFDAALHFGTALALLAYFWRDWLALLAAFWDGLRSAQGRAESRWKLIWMLGLGSLPGGVVGFLFEDQIEALLRGAATVAAALIVVAVLMWLADRFSPQRRKVSDLGYRDALLVGLAQATALWPGVSRSGATIATGLALGMTREAAARFSFLLATPIVVAAGLYQVLKDVVLKGMPPGETTAFAAGMLAAFLVGLAAIGFLLRYVQRYSLAVFVVYRVILGIVVLLVASTP
jgi:undecaprenyl-diphosphatase